MGIGNIFSGISDFKGLISSQWEHRLLIQLQMSYHPQDKLIVIHCH